MGLWEIGKVGLPFAVLSVIVMVIVTPLLLPERRAPIEDQGEDAREFTVEMIVQPGAAVAGRSVAEAGLRNLQGVYLVEIERDGHRISSVRPDEILAEGDRLTFAGNVERIIDLQGITRARLGRGAPLRPGGPRARPAPVRGGDRAGLVAGGQHAEGGGLPRPFGGAVIAIHRADERVGGKLGDVRLRTGDVLVVLAGPAFRPRALDRRDFLVVSALEGEPPPISGQGPVGGPRHRRR